MCNEFGVKVDIQNFRVGPMAGLVMAAVNKEGFSFEGRMEPIESDPLFIVQGVHLEVQAGTKAVSSSASTARLNSWRYQASH